MRCPDENVLAEYVDNVLGAAQRRGVEQHLDSCAACRTVVSDLARMLHAGDETTVATPNAFAETEDSTLHPTMSVPVSGTTATVDIVRHRKRTAQIVPGTMIGEYEVTGVLGAGGMGIVFAAVHPRIGKRAAIKILQKELTADHSAIVRFENEARAVNEIGHPNIVDIFSFGELPNGDPYYVMEHVEGQSLHQWIHANGPVSLERAMPILRQICDALSAAHDRNIIHRDLKPGNIMVGGSADAPRVKVLDFGLAKMVRAEHDGDELTVPGVAIGTPAFMSPEQFMAREVDQRTDIYALGVIVYQMLCGTYPFQGSTPSEIGNQHLFHTPQAPSKLMGLPEELDRIIDKAFAKEATDRYPTIADFRRDLEKCVADAPARASSPRATPDESTLKDHPPAPLPPLSSTTAQTRTGARNRMLAIGGASAIVAFVIIWIVAGRGETPKPAARVDEVRAPAPPVEQPQPPVQPPAVENDKPVAATLVDDTPVDDQPVAQTTNVTATAKTGPGNATKTAKATTKTTTTSTTKATTPTTKATTPTHTGSATVDDDRMLLEGGSVKTPKRQ